VKTYRFLAVGIAAVGALALLAGCSGGGSADYCKIYNDNSLKDLDPFGDSDQFNEALSKMEKAAPDDLKGDIKTVAEAFRALSGIDMEDYEAVAKAMEGIDQEEISAAVDRVSEKSDELCR